MMVLGPPLILIASSDDGALSPSSIETGWLLPNEVRNRYTERSLAHDHTLELVPLEPDAADRLLLSTAGSP